jgi:hypothetical protein
MTVALRACLVAALSTCAGCIGTHHGHPEKRGPRQVESRTRPDLPVAKQWHRVYFGSPPQKELMGYMLTAGAGEPGAGTRWVYDVDFRLVGWISPDGDTTRVTPRGERRVGGFQVENALRRLWVASRRTEVTIKAMPAPRG